MSDVTSMSNELMAKARARIATCDIYLGRNAVVREQWAVVSDMWNRRGCYSVPDKGVAIGPYHREMPTLWERKDAEMVASDMNAYLGSIGSRERVSLIHHLDWWAKEKEAAQNVIDDLEGGE